MSPEEKEQKIERLEQENLALRERIAELERRLGLDSQTSSKPPSSDGLKKSGKIRTKSLREKGKRPSGGQFGHPGQTLKQVLCPDNVVEHPTPCSCLGCGYDISVVVAEKIIKRQVFDIPAPQIIVTEHQVATKECPGCKALIQGIFPESVKAPVQYGARIRAVAAYLYHQHFIPEDRLSEVVDDLFDCRMTPGTIANITLTLAKIIEPIVIEIASKVKTSPVKHLDETGFRIGGKTKWLHVVSTESLTWYRVADKRKDIEVLTDIKGLVVHDHWNPYYQLVQVSRALCNAHHLRELKALEEIEQEPWAKSMKKLLLLACNYKHRYQSGIPKNIVTRLNQLYEQILK
jgi:transposase